MLNSEQPRREQSDIVESDSENYTEGTNDPGPDCTDGESDEEETEFKRDELIQLQQKGDFPFILTRKHFPIRLCGWGTTLCCTISRNICPVLYYPESNRATDNIVYEEVLL